jgi:hypothetical protein
VVSVAPLPRMPRAKEEALAIGRTVIPPDPTLHVSQHAVRTDARRVAGKHLAAGVARSLAMVALAAFAILVLLPAAVAAQAAV